jgi:hypothetical protein
MAETDKDIVCDALLGVNKEMRQQCFVCLRGMSASFVQMQLSPRRGLVLHCSDDHVRYQKQ